MKVSLFTLFCLLALQVGVICQLKGADLYQCNSYKCECPDYQHHCPDTPWCVNDWDTCRPDQDVCPHTSGACHQCEFSSTFVILFFGWRFSAIFFNPVEVIQKFCVTQNPKSTKRVFKWTPYDFYTLFELKSFMIPKGRLAPLWFFFDFSN